MSGIEIVQTGKDVGTFFNAWVTYVNSAQQYKANPDDSAAQQGLISSAEALSSAIATLGKNPTFSSALGGLAGVTDLPNQVQAYQDAVRLQQPNAQTAAFSSIAGDAASMAGTTATFIGAWATAIGNSGLANLMGEIGENANDFALAVGAVGTAVDVGNWFNSTFLPGFNHWIGNTPPQLDEDMLLNMNDPSGDSEIIMPGAGGDTLAETSLAGNAFQYTENNAQGVQTSAVQLAYNGSVDDLTVEGVGVVADVSSFQINIANGATNATISGSGNQITAGSGSTFTLEGTGTTGDTLDLAGATDVTVLLGDATTMVDLGINNSLTIDSLSGGGTVTGASGDNVNLEGNGITLNASGGQYTLEGSGDAVNLSNGSVTLDAGISATLNGVNSAASSSESVTLDYGSNGQDNENIYNFTSGGSQTQYFTDLPSGVSEQIDNFTGANGTGTETSDITDYSSGYSTETLLSGLGGGIASEIEDFSGTNATGVNTENIYNFTTGGSQTQTFSGLPGSDSEIVDQYSGVNGAGSLNWQITDLSSGSSTQTYYTGLASGESSETEYFTGTNASGTQTEDLYNFTNGTSQEQFFTGLPSGDKSIIEDYSGANGTGTETEDLYNFTNGSSQAQFFTGLSNGESELINDYTGANGAGTLSWQIADFTAGNSQETLYTGLAAGESSETVAFTGTNATGTQTEDLYNFTNGTSQAQFFAGLGNGESELINDYTGANGAGTLSWQITDFTSGDSQETFYTGLSSGETSLSEYYAGTNGTGANTWDLIDLSNGTSQEQLFTGLPSGDSEVLQNYSGSNGTGSMTQQLVDFTNRSAQLDLYSGGQLTSQDNFNSSSQLTSEYLFSGGKETQEDLFTPGDNYASTEIYFNVDGAESYQATFNPITGQESQEDIFNGSTTEQERLLFTANDPYASTEMTFYSNGDESSQINFNTVGQELENILFNSMGQETEAELFNPGQAYAYEECFFTGGNYASQIDLFNQSTGTETGYEDFNASTGQETASYAGGSSMDGGYTDDSSDWGDSFWDGGYGYFGGYGFAGSASTVQAAVGSNIGSIAQADLANGNQTGAAAAQAALSQASQIASTTPTSGTGNAVLEGAQWDSQIITWSFAAPAGTDSAAEATYMAQVQQAFATWAAASGLTFEEASSPSQANIQIGFGQLGTASTGVVGYTTGTVQGGQIEGANIKLEDPSQDALATGADGQLTYAGTAATLEQVLLHEIGHALGLADNADQSSVMYYELTSANRTLDATDLAGMQSLYGGAASPLSSSSAGSQVDQLIQTMAAYAPASSSVTSPAVIAQLSTQPLLAASLH
jgi:hypothetical protein